VRGVLNKPGELRFGLHLERLTKTRLSSCARPCNTVASECLVCGISRWIAAGEGTLSCERIPALISGVMRLPDECQTVGAYPRLPEPARELF